MMSRTLIVAKRWVDADWTAFDNTKKMSVIMYDEMIVSYMVWVRENTIFTDKEDKITHPEYIIFAEEVSASCQKKTSLS